MNWIEELRRLLMGAKRDAPVAVSCQEAAERVFEWLDGELGPEMASQVGGHLEKCARCYPMLRFERAYLEALKRAAEGESAPEELRHRVLKSLETEGFTSS